MARPYASVWGVSKEKPGRRLGREDWTAEALRALGNGGLAAVSIEPIAARLGTTKGSGYWHFRDRADLVAATLARWEAEHTEAVIAQAERGADAAARLRELFRVVLGRSGPFTVELALLASAEDPLVAPTVRRVTQRRIGYLRELFAGLGFDPAQAQRRALLAYTTYLGHAQLARTDPEAVPTGGPARQSYLDWLLHTMTGGE
jgi:AcrR family transcriptional regulator